MRDDLDEMSDWERLVVWSESVPAEIRGGDIATDWTPAQESRRETESLEFCSEANFNG